MNSKMTEVALKSYDLLYLSVAVFEVPNPKAVIQMIHGAKEHKERYYEFINWLTANGFNVVISDTRSHGKSINGKYPLGYMENFSELIKDQEIITNFIENKFPGLDIYLFGHSFGSMLARIYLEKSDNKIKKLVLSGTVNYNEEVSLGILIGKIIIKLKGKTKSSELLSGFANFNKDDWVVSDPGVLEKYRNDPLCHYHYSNQALMTIFNANKELHNYKNYKCQNPSLKILSVSGSLDPITGGITGLKDTINTLNKIGYTNIENKVYQNMKHEVLNEYNKEQVFKDIINFYLN